jgi:hypothetical protein
MLCNYPLRPACNVKSTLRERAYFLLGWQSARMPYSTGLVMRIQVGEENVRHAPHRQQLEKMPRRQRARSLPSHVTTRDQLMVLSSHCSEMA